MTTPTTTELWYQAQREFPCTDRHADDRRAHERYRQLLSVHGYVYDAREESDV